MARVTRAKTSGVGGKQGGDSAYLAWWQKYVPVVLLEALTFLFYFPSLSYQFQFDDIANITKNFSIRHDNPLMRWWWHRRWVSDWLNRLNYKIGAFEPFYYRLLNVLIHMASGALVFFIVLKLCQFLKNEFYSRHAVLIAALTSGLFLLHPLQTQTVSYVIQGRVEGAVSLLMLLAIFMFLKIVTTQSRPQKIFWGTLLGLVSVVGSGTKEIFILVPVLMILIDWVFMAGSSLAGMKARKGFYLFFMPFFAFVTAHYLFEMRIVSNERKEKVVNLECLSYNENNIGNVLTEKPGERIRHGQFAMSQLKVVLHYMRLAVWPFSMSVEYDWKMAPAFFSPQVIVPLFFLLSLWLLCLAWLILGKFHLATFGLLWFFISLFPRSVVPSAELACDYKTYLAMMGLYLILSLGVVWLFDRLAHGWLALLQAKIFFLRVVLPGIAVLGLPCGLMTYQRNHIWQSNENFWADCVKKAPKKARVHNNYGVALCEVGKLDQAIQEYELAIKLDQRYQDPLSNLAVAYSMKGQPEKAVVWLKRAIALAPFYPEAHNNLGSLYVDLGRLDDAEQMLNRALELRPYYGKAFFNLARVAETRGDMEKVWGYLKKATEGDLDVREAFTKLALAGLKTNRIPEAIEAFERAFKLGETDGNVWFNYANAHYLAGSHDKAIAVYRELIKQAPDDHRFYYNMGEACFAKQDYRGALAAFHEATKRPHFLGQVIFRIATCFEKLKELERARDFLANVVQDNLTPEFKEHLNNEIVRYTLQSKINATGGVHLADLNNIAQQKREMVAERAA